MRKLKSTEQVRSSLLQDFSRLGVLLSRHRVKGAGMMLPVFGVFHVMQLVLFSHFL